MISKIIGLCFLLFGIIACNQTTTIPPDACKTSRDQMQMIVQQWNVVVSTTDATPNSDLLKQIAELQTIHNRMSILTVDGCGTRAHQYLLASMDATITAYQKSLNNQPSKDAFLNAYANMRAYRTELWWMIGASPTPEVKMSNLNTDDLASLAWQNDLPNVTAVRTSPLTVLEGATDTVGFNLIQDGQEVGTIVVLRYVTHSDSSERIEIFFTGLKESARTLDFKILQSATVGDPLYFTEGQLGGETAMLNRCTVVIHGEFRPNIASAMLTYFNAVDQRLKEQCK